MRDAFRPGQKMEKEYALMFENAEVSRSAAFMLQCFGRVGTKGYGKSDLRTEIIKELKSLRDKTKKKEAQTLPPVLLAQVQKVLWDQ